MEELLKCPFCGGEPKKRKAMYVPDKSVNYYYIFCMGCFCQTAPHQEQCFNKAVEAWNRRVRT